MKWSRAHTLLAAAAAVMVAANGVALTGVVWNRAGKPDATLRLSQRELQVPYQSVANRENSGLAVILNWRVLQERKDTASGAPSMIFAGTGGNPDWLDGDKMRSLGFDTSADEVPDPAHPSGRRRLLPREVLLVLEQDGAAYRHALQLATEYLARQEALLAAAPGNRSLQTQVKSARDVLAREASVNSRMFVVDAGIDADALRASYPDATRYAIVRGQVRPVYYGRSGQHAGYVSKLAAGSLNVPLGLRAVFGNAPQRRGSNPRSEANFEATVAFGKRFEPWIVAAEKR